MNFLKNCLFISLVLIESSYQKCFHGTEETVVKMLGEEFYIFNPIILGPSKLIQVDLIKTFSNFNQYSSTFEHEENHHLILILKESNLKSKDKLPQLEKVGKGLIIVEDLMVSDLTDMFRFEIHQEIYFYEAMTCTLYEKYEINNVKIERVLGKVNNFKFIWNTNVQER